jgi:PAS domain S-box-containing protein
MVFHPMATVVLAAVAGIAILPWPLNAAQISLLLFGLPIVGATILSERRRSGARQVTGGQHRKITDQEKAQVALRESEERYRFSLEAANVGTWEWTIATGEDRWSANMESIHGMLPGSFHGTIQDMMRTVHPEDREMVSARIKRSIDTSEPYEVEYRTIGPGGQVGWIGAKGRVVYDPRTGRPLRMIGVSMNITERKKNEEERSRLAAIVDASNEAIMSLAPDGTVLTWNGGAERIYGYSAQEMIGRNISILTPPDRSQETVRKLAALRRGESIHNFEARRQRKDGRTIWILMTASPIRDGRGQVVAISAIARDITEIKVLEEQLRQAAKLESLGVLAGGIAHDFNNLLVGILGNASLAKNTLPAASSVRQMLDDVISAGERAAVLTRQLLAYAGKGKFVIQPLDISALVREMANLVHASVPKRVAVRLRLAPSLPAVVADEAQLQQLIMNLIINAAEAIGDNSGTVTVTTGNLEISGSEIKGATGWSDPATPGRYVFFEVEDTGAGMDEATIARIFDPFFTTKSTGRGLGLSAALGIVRGHHGFIQVISSPGRGSTFKVLFPAAREEIAPESVQEAQNDLTGSGVILLVDDEELVRRMAGAALAQLGYTVLEAGNGREAIELFQRHSSGIRLVILDLSMPVMNGEECLTQVRSIRADVPVLLSSGFGETEAASRFQSAGVTSFLQKPYTAQYLAELVKATLTGSGRL